MHDNYYFDEMREALIHELQRHGIYLNSLPVQDIFSNPATMREFISTFSLTFLNTSQREAREISKILAGFYDLLETRDHVLTAADYREIAVSTQQFKRIIGLTLDSIEGILENSNMIRDASMEHVVTKTEEIREDWEMAKLAVEMVERKMTGVDDFPDNFDFLK